LKKKKIALIGNICQVLVAACATAPHGDEVSSGKIHTRLGGVSYNIARNLAPDNSINVELITVLSSDTAGAKTAGELKHFGIHFEHSLYVPAWTSWFVDVNFPEDHFGVEDMGMIQELTPKYLESIKNILEGNDLIVFDLNLSEECIDYLVQAIQVPLFCEGTSNTLCRKIIKQTDKLDTLKLNLKEACLICGLDDKKFQHNIQETELVDALRKLNVKHIFVTLGALGSMYVSQYENFFLKKEALENCHDVLGAGDAFAAGVICGLLNDVNPFEVLKRAAKMAEQVLIANNRPEEKNQEDS
jgi:sugar/nucleoside kinase (ribokinase family)